MSVLREIKDVFMPFVDSVSNMIGRVVYDYTGVRSSEMVNDVIFYMIAAFCLFLLLTIFKRPESVYRYRHKQ